MSSDADSTHNPNAAGPQAVTDADVLHVAALAHLELTADELPALVRDLNSVLGHIVQLGEVNTDGIEPMAQVADVLGLAADAHGERLRGDAVKPSVDRTAVMSEAPDTDGRFFKVPRVLDR